MRTYSVDSPHAAGRILALTMIVDGNLAGAELAAMDRSKILEHIDLDHAVFQCLLQDLCDDLLTSTSHATVRLDNMLIDSLLSEIVDPDLRRSLLCAMWSIADADGWLADAEAVLLTRASHAWSAETNFRRPGYRAD
ncbi:MAG: TerB family tellurite resistance protein [Telluria sp.]